MHQSTKRIASLSFSPYSKEQKCKRQGWVPYLHLSRVKLGLLGGLGLWRLGGRDGLGLFLLLWCHGEVDERKRKEKVDG